MKIGKKLKQAREEKGLRQKELASLLNKSQGVYSYYEKDLTPISLFDLKKIADYLGKPLSFFFEEEDKYITRNEVEDLIKNKLASLEPIDLSGRVMSFPVYSGACCGQAVFSEANIIDYLDLPSSFVRRLGNVTTIFKASGTSMEEYNISDGDYVFLSRRDNYNSGDIVVVMKNGGELLIKKFQIIHGRPIFLDGKGNVLEIKEAEESQIVGKVVKILKDPP